MMYDFSTGSRSLSGRTLSRLIGLACSIAFILFGYGWFASPQYQRVLTSTEQGVMGGVITGPAFTKQFPSINTTTANGNTRLQGFTVASYNIGCWAGSLLTMFIGDRLGRKRTIIIGASVLAVGTVIQCSSYGLPQLIVGRIITGTGNGIITSTIPVWHAELSKAQSRGKFITTELSTNVVSEVLIGCIYCADGLSGWCRCSVLGRLRDVIRRQRRSVAVSNRLADLLRSEHNHDPASTSGDTTLAGQARQTGRGLGNIDASSRQ